MFIIWPALYFNCKPPRNYPSDLAPIPIDDGLAEKHVWLTREFQKVQFAVKPDFLVVTFKLLDPIQHDFMQTGREVSWLWKWYNRLDMIAEWAMDKSEKWMILSDHGCVTWTNFPYGSQSLHACHTSVGILATNSISLDDNVHFMSQIHQLLREITLLT